MSRFQLPIFRALIAVFLLLGSLVASGQEINHHVSNSNVYELLDELVNVGVIDLNTTIKPYSRKTIAVKLAEALEQKGELNRRQQKEVEFYLKDFNKELKDDRDFDRRRDLFYYKDSLFRITVNPIFGIQTWNGDSGSVIHRWNGGEFYGSVGEHFGFYASLRDNFENKRFSDITHLDQRQRAAYKLNGSGADYSEMRGGITYSWSWGSVGMIKDHFTWGNSYNGSNIFAGRQPSFAQATFKMRPVHWFELNYVHGWLSSAVIDTTRGYVAGVRNRQVFVPKYLAANMVSFRPWKKLIVSAGNSVVYSDVGLHPGYLMPIFFYKSVDHTVSNTSSNFAGQNAQMFFDVSSRQLNKWHFYTSLFIDEISISNMLDDTLHSNFYSWKIGTRWTNGLIPNTSFIVEYTRTNPMAFRHFVNTTTFETNEHKLGHYLGDNAQEIFLAVRTKPLAKLRLEASYTSAQKGDFYPYLGTGGNDARGLPFLDNVQWKSDAFNFKASYEIINDGIVFLDVMKSNRRGTALDVYTPSVFRGDQLIYSFGLQFGIP